MKKFKIKDGKLVKTESVDTEFTIEEIERKIESTLQNIQNQHDDIARFQAELDQWNALKAEYGKLKE